MSIVDIVTGKPKTIEELQDYCERNGFDSYRTRFFVGVDYKEPKAFGIYKDEETGEFVVYKNKDTGERAIRYQGPDEEFAVSELYDRLQAEIVNQKKHYYGHTTTTFESVYGDRESRSNSHDMDYLDRDIFPERYESYDSDEYRSSGRSNDTDPIVAIWTFLIIMLVVFVVCMGARNGGGSGRSHYDSGYSYDYNNYNDYDSGWSSDSWDSGYTDWGSDW